MIELSTIAEITMSIVLSYCIIGAIKLSHFVIFGLGMVKIFKKWDNKSDNALYEKLGFWIYNFLKTEMNKYEQPFIITILESGKENPNSH